MVRSAACLRAVYLVLLGSLWLSNSLHTALLYALLFFKLFCTTIPCLHLQGGVNRLLHQFAVVWQEGRRLHRGGICWLHIPLVSYTPLTTAKSDQSQRFVRSRPMRGLRQLSAAHSGTCRPISSSTHGCTVQHLALVNITCRLSNYTADGF